MRQTEQYAGFEAQYGVSWPRYCAYRVTRQETRPHEAGETLQGQVRSSHEIEPTSQSARGAGRSRREERGKNIETQDYRIGRNRVRTYFIAR